MALVSVVEFVGLASGSGQKAGVVQLPPVASQSLTFSATPGLSAAFNTATRIIRVQSDTNGFVAVGLAPVAAVTDLPIAAGVTEYFGVSPGHKISVRSA